MQMDSSTPEDNVRVIEHDQSSREVRDILVAAHLHVKHEEIYETDEACLGISQRKCELCTPRAASLDWIVLRMIEALDEAIGKHIHFSLRVRHEVDGAGFLLSFWATTVTSLGIRASVIIILRIVVERVVPGSV